MKKEYVQEDHVPQALRALAENDREKVAPPEVEARLLGAFRTRRRGRWRWAAILATAAALVITASLWWTNRRPQPAVSAAPQVSQLPDAVQPAPVAATMADIARAPRKIAHKVAAIQPESHEVVTDFFPLMNPEPSFERGQILRVQLPASVMQTVGLPVREEHLADLVQADVLVGEEGMARAIRFVRFDVK